MRLIASLAGLVLMAGCATGSPTAHLGIKEVAQAPSPQCADLGAITGRSYLGAGIVGASTGHALTYRDALDSADPAKLAKATHIVWTAPRGFGVSEVTGTLYACPA